MTHHLTITIDGPAGTGKSTTARRLAARLGLEFLDTGAMYRAAAVIAQRLGIDPADGPRLAEAVRDADLRFDWSADPPRLLLRWPGESDWSDVSPLLRTVEITNISSIVAGCREVRQVLVEAQRAIRRQHPRLVTEGRDQGSIVFPDADVKFYLTASAEARARRRGDQLRAMGLTVDETALSEEIRLRDAADMSRPVGPLTSPPGAIEVDTTGMNHEQVVRTLERHVRRRIGDL